VERVAQVGPSKLRVLRCYGSRRPSQAYATSADDTGRPEHPAGISTISDSMRIAYLIPEFPGQTHIMFWRERAALQHMGVTTHLVSTRRPPKTTRSHDWADRAERETFYLADIGLLEVFHIILQFIRFGPRAWFRAVRAAVEGNSLRDSLFNLVLLQPAVRLIIYMRANKLAHVHSHSCANSALVAMFANRLGNVSYSLTLHGDLRDYGSQQRLKWRYAAFAITITDRLRKQIHQQLREDVPSKIGLAPMGVDPEIFKRTEPYAPWKGIGPLRLFSCGRLNPSKGHQDLISAVSLLKGFGMDVYLEIAGEDEVGGSGFHRELDMLIMNLQLADIVVLLGAVDEQRVLESLKATHLFVLASHGEPLGVAIMEAMSSETPVLATNSGGVPELIEHGVDGFLIPPNDSSSLAEAIRYLANNPALTEELSRSGRSKIVQHFNSYLSARTLSRLLEEMK
jgi:colanic acid/amylovoran biosynthesis glycosyltransferase